MNKEQNFDDIKVNVDNLMIDMNGVFHNSAQKIYEYGNFKPNPRLLCGNKPRKKKYGINTQLKLFEDVCQTIEKIFKIVKPEKRLILCVDGPAPLSKQNQQRQRRFRSAMEQSDDSPFNSNCITPGTKFMDYLTKYIDWYIRKRINEDSSWRNVQVIFSNEKAPGEGEHKCLRKHTKILMWNGTIKNVEEIKVGDKVIGDDGNPRVVTSLVSGEEEMYEVIQNNAENYTVNKNHILSLQIANHKYIYWNEKKDGWIVSYYDRFTNKYRKKKFSVRNIQDNYSIVKTNGNIRNINKEESYFEALNFLNTIPDNNVLDISVTDYLKLTKNTQKKLYGFRCSKVNWPKKDVKINPYILGLWLGNSRIYTTDDEIVEFLNNKYFEKYDSKLHSNSKHNIYDIIEILKSYNLIKKKHIPIEYIVNDEQVRLEILAGIIDSDDSVTKEKQIIHIYQSSENKKLVDDIVYLARSLGFSLKLRMKNLYNKYDEEKKTSKFYKIIIYGKLQRIPNLIKNKKCCTSLTVENKNHSMVTDKLKKYIKVKSVGKDKYYGFNTDGNHRFLLGDFTVTHNCIQFIRYYGNRDETYCINGLDADLIMLALGTHITNFYILREDLYDSRNEFFCVDIGAVRTELVNELRWKEHKYKFDSITAINDFIFLCFMVGNDFLPHIPSIEIIEQGIELILEVYKETGTSYGHITETIAGQVKFQTKPLSIFLGTIGQHEKNNFEHKMRKKESFFPDPLLEGACVQNEGKWNIDIEKYKKEYHKTCFPESTDEEILCHAYFEGMQWVLSYYTRGVPNWKWHFPYHYAPCASTLAKYTNTFKFPSYGRTIPSTPFQQLLCVLPPKSANLIPEPLCRLLTDNHSPLKEYCPEEFKIDISGKRKEWEGIVILPMVDFNMVRKCYLEILNKVSNNELKRNLTGRSFVYEYVPSLSNTFHSYYGDIEKCCVRIVMIDL